MRKIIYRVDDRFIHGQVLEGWINHFRIQDIIIVSDAISNDRKKSLIYNSIIPFSAKLTVLKIDDYLKLDLTKLSSKFHLIILGSVTDLLKISNNILADKSYINIGCLATGEHSICVTDNCYLSITDFDKLKTLSDRFDIFAHKLPWDEHVSIRALISKRENL